MKVSVKTVSLGILAIMLIYGFAHQEGVYRLAYRLKNGNERVYYHSRTYYSPQERSWAELQVNGEEMVPTGEKVIGLAVMDTPYSMQLQKERNVVPTVLTLKLSDDKFLIYSLSGGP